MKTTTALSVASLLSALAGAVPVADKRHTVWDIVIETVYTTTTVWVQPGEATPAPTATQGAFYDRPTEEELTENDNDDYSWEHSYSHASSTTAAPVRTTTTPTSTPTPTPTSTSTSTSTSAPAAVYTPPPTYEQPPAEEYKPEPEVEQPEPEPEVEAQQPPAEETYEPAPVVPEEPASSGGYPNHGELTYYDPGLGSCGIISGPDEPVVALSHVLMTPGNGGNPNNNPMCGQYITAEYEGKLQTLKIVDTCMGCVSCFRLFSFRSESVWLTVSSFRPKAISTSRPRLSWPWWAAPARVASRAAGRWTRRPAARMSWRGSSSFLREARSSLCQPDLLCQRSPPLA